MRTAVLLSGGGTNLQAIIDAQAAGRLPVEICAAIADRPAFGLERARHAGIDARLVDYRAHGDRAAAEAELETLLDRLAPDLVVLAGFLRVLSDGLVARYAGRMLNVHPSLLPRYRGLDTYRRVLAAGDPWHGSTVHFVVPELDAGPAIVQYRIAVRPGDTAASLRARVQAGEHRIYPQAIGWFATGRLALRGGAAWLDDERLAEPVLVDEPAPDPARAQPG